MSIIAFIDLTIASGGILAWFLVEDQKSDHDECRVHSKQLYM